MPKNTEQSKKCKCEDGSYEIIDVFGMGDLTDQHIDIDVSEEELIQRYQSANEAAKRMGGTSNTGLLEEIGVLAAPKMTWEDFVAFTLGNKKEGVGRNDWGSPRSRALFYGQYLPKKKLNTYRILILIDRSSSVSIEDATQALSQIQVLGLSAEGYVVCFDTEPHYDEAVHIESAEIEELLKIKYIGGGGTLLVPTLYSYEKELGPMDLVIILTDGGIFDLVEINKKHTPNNDTQFLWILNKRNAEFKPGFGRVFALNND